MQNLRQTHATKMITRIKKLSLFHLAWVTNSDKQVACPHSKNGYILRKLQNLKQHLPQKWYKDLKAVTFSLVKETNSWETMTDPHLSSAAFIIFPIRRHGCKIQCICITTLIIYMGKKLLTWYTRCCDLFRFTRQDIMPKGCIRTIK